MTRFNGFIESIFFFKNFFLLFQSPPLPSWTRLKSNYKIAATQPSKQLVSANLQTLAETITTTIGYGKAIDHIRKVIYGRGRTLCIPNAPINLGNLLVTA